MIILSGLNAENIRTLIALLSLLSPILSGISLLITRKFWLATNRPIICANIVTNKSGNEIITYNLVIYNTGNRPAVNIQLKTDWDKINTIFVEKTDKNEPYYHNVDVVKRCFKEENIIPLILNSGSVSNSFGFTGKNGILRYKSKFIVEIFYGDIEGRTYKSKQELIVKTSEGFADGSWN
jgi:hypothetical protein